MALLLGSRLRACCTTFAGPPAGSSGGEPAGGAPVCAVAVARSASKLAGCKKASPSTTGGRAAFAVNFSLSPLSAEDFTMAEINKLSAGQALDKLRGTDAPRSRMTRLDEEIGALDEETQRLRMTRRRLERDQRAGSTRSDGQQANTNRVTKLIISGITIGIVIVILILAWNGGLF